MVSHAAGMRLAESIDATLLTPWAEPAEIRRLCEEACALEVAAVCVLPFHVPLARAIVSGTRVRVAAAVSFPGGGAPAGAKAAEARWCAERGAEELDLVMNLGAARAGAWEAVADEVRAVRDAAPGCLAKWILEAGALGETEIVRAVGVVGDGGGHFVKTSTGYGPGGATVEAVRLLRSVAGTMGVKASGGIRTRIFALALLDAGADRIGTSAAGALLRAGAAGALLRAGAAGALLRG